MSLSDKVRQIMYAGIGATAIAFTQGCCTTGCNYNRSPVYHSDTYDIGTINRQMDERDNLVPNGPNGIYKMPCDMPPICNPPKPAPRPCPPPSHNPPRHNGGPIGGSGYSTPKNPPGHSGGSNK